MKIALSNLLLATALVSSPSIFAEDMNPARDITTKVEQQEMTPDQALDRLKIGNMRFTDGKSITDDYLYQMKETASGQYPFAAVISCLDSRSAPEVVFDQAIGDLFVGRVAGNIVNEDLLGSLEFATKVAGAKLIVVMGHTECGAVKGACDNVKLGNLTTLLEKISPAVSAVSTMADEKADKSSKNKEFVKKVTDKNVDITVKNIVEKSPVIAELAKSGQVKVVGAVHDISTGKVTWM